MSIKLLLGATTALIGAGSIALASTSSAAVQESAGSFAGDRIEISNFIGSVELRTGGSDVQVSIRNPGDVAEDPMLNGAGGGVSIDGGQSVRNLNCNSRNGQIRIGRRWGDREPIENYPTLVITAPASAELVIRDSAFVGEAGDLGRLDVEMDSCGRFETGAVSGDVVLNINGSGDITTRNVGGGAMIDINGSGDVILGTVGQGALVEISGSGDVETGDLGGDAEVDINGSGDVTFGRVAGLDVDISGSGDVSAREMNGAFDADIAGSGDIVVRGGRAEPFEASIRGSGDIDFSGTAVNVTVRQNGGGDIEIDEIEGSIDWRRDGRTILRVGSAD